MTYPRVKYKGKYRFKHSVEWEKYYGPVPEGKVLHHRDKNKKNYHISNLELLTVADHALLHKEDSRDKTKKNKTTSYKYKMVKGKSKLLSRLVMEEFLGRKLTKDEVVHHRDENKQNNDVCNLQVMTRSEHLLYHIKKREKEKNKQCRYCKGTYYSLDCCKSCYEKLLNYKKKNIIPCICNLCGKLQCKEGLCSDCFLIQYNKLKYTINTGTCIMCAGLTKRKNICSTCQNKLFYILKRGKND